jgi:hypothetical protein
MLPKAAVKILIIQKAYFSRFMQGRLFSHDDMAMTMQAYA